jgi:3-deoxy-7-phosphoheptulonate synthase
MIIVMKPGAPASERAKIKNNLEKQGFQINEIVGTQVSVLGIIGDTSVLDINMLKVNDWVDKVMRVQEPFKRANRAFHPDDSIIDVSGVKIGGRKVQVMAGPCSVETKEQVISVAKSVKLGGATMLRGGAFKPRTSPYSFQGLGLSRTGFTGGSQERNRTPDCHRNHEHRCSGPL